MLKLFKNWWKSVIGVYRIVISITCADGTAANTSEGEIELTRIGKTTAIRREATDNGRIATCTAIWDVSKKVINLTYSDNASGVAGTAYFYY